MPSERALLLKPICVLLARLKRSIFVVNGNPHWQQLMLQQQRLQWQFWVLIMAEDSSGAVI
jgi:hypothetical protein